MPKEEIIMAKPSPSLNLYLENLSLDCSEACLNSIRANKCDMTNKHWKKLNKIYSQLVELKNDIISPKPKGL